MPGQPQRLSPPGVPASAVESSGTGSAAGKNRGAAGRRLIVIGSGIAGLYAALLAAGQGADVVLLSKGRLSDSNTWYAQGGISAVLAGSAAGDTVAAHIQDTLRAGAGHCDVTAVQRMCTEAGGDIAGLERFGVHFDTDDGGVPALGLEAAHSAPRILHAGGDATGAKVAAALIDSVLALADAGGLTVLSQAHATVLLQRKGRVTGVEFLRKGQRNVFHADAVLLATGGAGQLFARTTNPAGATADGLALAVRAGAAVADLEFLQFHPTCLVGGAGTERSGTGGLAGSAPDEGPLLISEAVRGEGAFLVDGNGRRFMQAYHPDAELAPRDVVSRSIALHLAKLGDPCGQVYLDARAVERTKGSGFLAKRFPTLTRKTLDAGFDWTRDLVPVAPAAHYWMGGIATDLHGRTSVPGLLAAGEAACTGVQGANRLASNSLLEAVVFSRRAVQAFLTDDLTDDFDGQGPGRAPVSGRLAAVRGGGARADDARRLEAVEDGACTVPFSRDALRKLMTAKAGVLRDGVLLAEAASTLAGWAAVVRPEAVDARGGQREHEDRNLLLAAQMLVAAARSRPHSLGAHYRNDCPAPHAGTADELQAIPPIRPKASLLHD